MLERVIAAAITGIIISHAIAVNARSGAIGSCHLFLAKASVVQQRAEAKDYIDIDALLTDGRVDLPMALAAARTIHGMGFNPQSTLKALCYFDDGNLSRLPRHVKDRLVKAVREVDLDRLPVIAFSSSAAHDDGGFTQ
jgi:hypothetical protein